MSTVRWQADLRFFRLLLALFFAAVCMGQSALAQGTGQDAPALLWWQQAAHFIVNPGVTVALLVAGCVLLFHDLLTPLTWGATGTVGVLFLGTVFAAQILVGQPGWVGVLLLLVGMTGILLEIHVWPGRGSALAGFVFLFAGMYLSLNGRQNTLFALSVSSALIVASGLAFLAYLPKSPAWQNMRKQIRHAAASGGATEILLGHTGTALTVLRPDGLAEIDGLRVSVVTEGDFIPAGQPLVVTQVEGDRIVVQNPAGTSSAPPVTA